MRRFCNRAASAADAASSASTGPEAFTAACSTLGVAAEATVPTTTAPASVTMAVSATSRTDSPSATLQLALNHGEFANIHEPRAASDPTVIRSPDRRGKSSPPCHSTG